MSDLAKRDLKSGDQSPYDALDSWRNSDLEETPPPSKDWAHSAARGILHNLSDRRGIKWELANIDENTRIEIVSSIAEIIRASRDD